MKKSHGVVEVDCYVVTAVHREIGVCVPTTIERDIEKYVVPCSWAKGMYGAFPVFLKPADALAYMKAQGIDPDLFMAGKVYVNLPLKDIKNDADCYNCEYGEHCETDDQAVDYCPKMTIKVEVKDGSQDVQ